MLRCNAAVLAYIYGCYNIGMVTGSGYNIGGIAGAVDDNDYVSGVRTQQCFCLDGCVDERHANSGEITYAYDYNVLTDAEMREMDYLYEQVWTMEGNPNYPYPELIGLPHTDARIGDLAYADGVLCADISLMFNYYDSAKSYVAVYDKSGRLVGLKSASAEDGTVNIDAVLSEEQTYNVKLMIWDNELEPYMVSNTRNFKVSAD